MKYAAMSFPPYCPVNETGGRVILNNNAVIMELRSTVAAIITAAITATIALTPITVMPIGYERSFERKCAAPNSPKSSLVTTLSGIFCR